MLSSGMLRHVAPVRIDVAEERIVCIIRMTRIGELVITRNSISSQLASVATYC
jgi:hypothetical protein